MEIKYSARQVASKWTLAGDVRPVQREFLACNILVCVLTSSDFSTFEAAFSFTADQYYQIS